VLATATAPSKPRTRGARERELLAASQRELAAARAEIGELKSALAKALEKITELEARLKENSASSNRPPSSDVPWNKPPQRPRERSGRKRGAQPGHRGNTRPLVPVEQVSAVVHHFAETCRGCGAHLPPREVPGAPAARRHQITEAPPVQPVITEHQAHGTPCKCGTVTFAEFPPEIRASSFGPRLQAMAALLTGRYRLSRREAAEAIKDLAGIDISVGSVSALEEATSEALKTPYEEARKAVRDAGVVNADETGWRNGSARAWLWIAITPLLAVFWIDPRRNRAAFERFLGHFAGFLGTDRWGAYLRHPKRLHQLCWAHLLRDFERLVLRGGEAKKLGLAAIAEIKAIFALWHRFRRAEISRAALRRQMKPIQDRFYDLLIEGTQCSHTKAGSLCAKLVPLWRCLWLFLRVPGLEPTNNAGERDLRKAVLWRKGSFGSESDRGCLYVSRILTAVGSLRKQERDVLGFLEQAIRAHRADAPPPSLLPSRS
jgi:transposase